MVRRRKLTAEQRELSLQAMIAWEIQNLPEDQRTGYMGAQECSRSRHSAEHPVQVGCHPLIEIRSRCNQQDVGAPREPTVQYAFRLGDTEVPVNPLIGTRCAWSTSGHSLHPLRPQDQDQFQPGLLLPVHDQTGPVRPVHHEPRALPLTPAPAVSRWGEQFCMTDHVVYLANSSGIKVGITRATQLPTRWLDQGASQALPIMRVSTRQQSGFVEDLFRSQVADKTNWRALLKGDAQAVDLKQVRDELFDACAEAW
jgi:hypothetical protein